MPDTVDTSTQTPAQPIEKNPFDEKSWTSAPEAIVTEPPVMTTVTEPATPTTEKKEEFQYVEPNEWLKQNYGWDNVDAGKTELAELRRLKEQAQTPAEHKFANDEAKKYYEAITGGKGDDLYNILHQQKQLERLEKLPLANATEAAEIIKTNLQYKHQDLTPDEVNFLYNKRYALPAKPIQGDQEDADYAVQLESWKQAVQEKEQEIVIEAKLAKPELAKYKSELKLPDIPKVETPQGPSQEDLAAQEAFANNFFQQLQADKKFSGYKTMVKDEAVELPISYIVADEEKAGFNETVKKAVLNLNDFVDKDLQWWDETTKSFNVDKMQEDLYLLINKDKVFQKIANEAAAKKLDHYLKLKSNIKVDGTGQPAPSTNGAHPKEMEEKTIWSA